MGTSRRAMWRNNVLFPIPFRPMIPYRRPWASVSEALDRMRRLPKVTSMLTRWTSLDLPLEEDMSRGLTYDGESAVI